MLMMPMSKPRSGFPSGTYMVVGSLIILVALIGLAAGLALSIGNFDEDYMGRTVGMLITPFVGFGIWEIVTGSLALCAACTTTRHRQMGLKIGFMVMCIVTLLTTMLFFAIFLSVAIYSLDNSWPYDEGASATVWVLVFTNLFQSILVITGASISCCCTPTGYDEM